LLCFCDFVCLSWFGLPDQAQPSPTIPSERPPGLRAGFGLHGRHEWGRMAREEEGMGEDGDAFVVCSSPCYPWPCPGSKVVWFLVFVWFLVLACWSCFGLADQAQPGPTIPSERPPGPRAGSGPHGRHELGCTESGETRVGGDRERRKEAAAEGCVRKGRRCRERGGVPLAQLRGDITRMLAIVHRGWTHCSVCRAAG